ncbi:hypothetical protein KY290_008878 [Solanum tuberosum]|uniref:Uncharacterized protein n=1 Tax=Solanum tuberosum TaxID=4113 RepID=A0ABQ7WCC7_SOLTU|nr:hypothetical protein KY290_008878 [Solanum tuberosum]
MEPVGPHGQNGPFSRSIDPRAGRPLRPYLWCQLDVTGKTAHFQGQMIPGNYEVIIAKILPGSPLRPYLWSQFALTAKMTHFQGQMIPGAEFRPHFCKSFT